jgi:inner membrane protein
MASIGHIAVGMAAARAYDPDRPPRWSSMALWSALSLLPDIDVVGFLRGVPYGAPWGHRGATHSLTLAVVGGIVTGLAARSSWLGTRDSGLGARWFKRPTLQTIAFATIVLASHGLLDTMTDGGLGAGLLWPFDLTRYFAPWRPIPVAPIGLDFFTLDGATVALSELLLFLPLWLFAFRLRQRAVAVAVWLIALWLIGSPDPFRERILGVALREDTVFAKGYSENAFRHVAVGDDEDVVRRSLGEPFGESWFFPPKGFTFQSAMEVSAAALPHGCFGVRLNEGIVEETHESDLCGALGLATGASRADVRRLLGSPSESCAEYSVSPHRGHFRMRMVCFLHGRVEAVFRRWI